MGELLRFHKAGISRRFGFFSEKEKELNTIQPHQEESIHPCCKPYECVCVCDHALMCIFAL